MQSGHKPSFHPDVEVLEERSLLAAHLMASLSGGLLRIEGTNQADQIIVRQENHQISVDNIEIRAGGRMRESVSALSVSRIEVRGLGGSDHIYLDSEVHGGQALRKTATVWG